ncbi:phosphatidylinositol-glycan biosynthesis class X protein-like [Pomacea canaliculata]|uniref:phosphatidylinositol-glycan biosynthesis class X protein-like n=1 Tax=Pomacea canaliculata TaxID=400727 RepID=UPI000D72CF10|nr:phosphatidylinositol-glycan biosynthesis class X protein-like [Pomacea canaliculata]
MSTTFYLLLLAVFFQLQLSVCNDVIVRLTRKLSSEGFHRDLKTTLIIEKNDIETENNACSVLLIESLPSGLYVDAFQLESHAKMGGPKVLTDMPVDTEAPEYLSGQHELYVFATIPPEKLVSSEVMVTISLPVHARYHKPSIDVDKIYVPIVMYHPRVLLNCSKQESRKVEAPCDDQNMSVCSWAEVTYRSDSHFVEFQVPVGYVYDTRVVVFGTSVVIILGCSFLLYIIAFFDNWKIKAKES